MGAGSFLRSGCRRALFPIDALLGKGKLRNFLRLGTPLEQELTRPLSSPNLLILDLMCYLLFPLRFSVIECNIFLGDLTDARC